MAFEADCPTYPQMAGITAVTSAGVPEQCVADQNYECPPQIEQCPPQSEQRNCCFGRDSCGGEGLNYVQSPPAVSFKPLNTYCRPTAPMESETVYQKSYYPIDACAAQQCRLGPFTRRDNIERAVGKLEDQTVTSLSYMGHCGVKPPSPIIPMSRSLLGQGPMSILTTHQHDYVPKPTMRQAPIMPAGSMMKTTGPLEKDTTFTLSYMPIDLCLNPPPKPIKPCDEYQKPTANTDNNTVYKLSYLPVCPPAKEDYLWAKKTSHSNPCAPIEKDTIYKLSYMGNCAQQKAEPQYPISCLKLFDGAPESCTVYKASYMPTCIDRPQPIHPESSLQRLDGPLEKDTVYTLSYMGHCNHSPPSPIVPAQSSLLGHGPMESMTTQKHDYVPKPICRTRPFIPITMTHGSTDGLDKDTVYKLSYIAPDLCNIDRARPIRQENQTCRSNAPMEHETTHSLSYMPVCPPRREPQPWAHRESYQRPTAPLECDTIQKMSYRPPGIFTNSSGNCCCHNTQQFKFENHTFPKAGIVN